MWVGISVLVIRIYSSYSLKDKRKLIKPLKDRIGTRFNMAVAEVDLHSLWRKAVLAFSTVSRDWKQVNRSLDQVNDFVGSTILGRGEILDSSREILSGVPCESDLIDLHR